MFFAKKTQPITTIAQGIVMGIVETIPGVSGSTLALIMGIYDNFIDFLHDVSSFFKVLPKILLGKAKPKDLNKAYGKIDKTFGGYLVFGMLLGIGVFSHIMSYLLHEHPVQTTAFFFGLIAASLRVPFSQVEKITSKVWGVFLGSSLLFYFLLGLNPADAASDPSRITLFVGGFFAICAMVLPGVSGSFVLLLFGLYDYVIGLVKELTTFSITADQLTDLMVVGIGLLLGFAIFVRILKKGLEKYPSYIMAFLAGLMLASLRILWPFYDGLDIPAAAILLATFAVVLLVNSKVSKKVLKI